MIHSVLLTELMHLAYRLLEGKIKHVNVISLVEEGGSKIVSWPAHRIDGSNPDNASNHVPKGFFRLDAKVIVDAMNMHPMG